MTGSRHLHCRKKEEKGRIKEEKRKKKGRMTNVEKRKKKGRKKEEKRMNSRKKEEKRKVRKKKGRMDIASHLVGQSGPTSSLPPRPGLHLERNEKYGMGNSYVAIGSWDRPVGSSHCYKTGFSAAQQKNIVF